MSKEEESQKSTDELTVKDTKRLAQRLAYLDLKEQLTITGCTETEREEADQLYDYFLGETLNRMRLKCSNDPIPLTKLLSFLYEPSLMNANSMCIMKKFIYTLPTSKINRVFSLAVAVVERITGLRYHVVDENHLFIARMKTLEMITEAEKNKNRWTNEYVKHLIKVTNKLFGKKSDTPLDV